MEIESSQSLLSSVRKAEEEVEMSFAGRSSPQAVVIRVNKKNEYYHGDETTPISSSSSLSSSSSINVVKINNEDGNCYESYILSFVIK